MGQPGDFERLSLIGGPLHRIGRRLGLVRGTSNTVPLGLALGIVSWVVLAVLALIQGHGGRLFSLLVIAGHVRLLVAIPAYFVCETWVDPRLSTFVETIVRSGVVPRETLPALDQETARIHRLRDSAIPEALFLVLMVAWSVLGARPTLEGAAAVFDPNHTSGAISLAGRWYWGLCLPMFRFLTLRWLWRLGLWAHFLWSVSRLKLRLLPTHPDSLGGLGYLAVVSRHFLPLILALSAVQAAAFASEVAAGTTQFEAIYATLALILIVDVVLFICPGLVFTPKLWACRVKGLSDYMVFASGYVNDFDRKWVHAKSPAEEPVLGTSDIQSLADLGNSMNAINAMRVMPLDVRLIAEYAVVALLPALPLLLLKYSIPELVQRVFSRLSGS
jgi:hypothetical protein